MYFCKNWTIIWLLFRALDTQAPITMGEDDDEQTGNCYRLPPMNSTHTAEKHDDRQDKPKYKRQEFMRPKYGAVSFDVIDAVNARLAAASIGEKQPPTSEFFNRIRYDTSIENDKINDVDVSFKVFTQSSVKNANFESKNLNCFHKWNFLKISRCLIIFKFKTGPDFIASKKRQRICIMPKSCILQKTSVVFWNC